MSARPDDRRIRGLRPPKAAVDPWRAHGWTIDDERRPNGRRERALTIFLAGSECPFTCTFCDLWRWTLDGPTPTGALPHQIDAVLRSLNGARVPQRLKLYNASNFFDARAVPREDLPRLAELSTPFEAVTVESHASMVGTPARELARRLSGRLEVAIGLETIHPAALAQSNKRLDLGQFARAAEFLAMHDIDLRVFVLLGMPHIPAQESVEWTVRTVAYAVEQGAAIVSIIPVRAGNGEMERLRSLGCFTPPTLAQLEAALDRCLTCGPGVVCADLWDIDRLAACSACAAVRIERLRRLNASGHAEPAIACAVCGA